MNAAYTGLTAALAIYRRLLRGSLKCCVQSPIMVIVKISNWLLASPQSVQSVEQGNGVVAVGVIASS